ncbi:tRNA 2-thiouridine synthesizing protein D [Pasteurella testudinis DSM 23072]|uniref:tRNA 2-thiouridine synthesizing protein D n=1 Tax=Pasteurella testudinis DSM 23072 TaxID=1122938 RepID=A0A1W1USU1_9PAST|nr:sulfurtransferase complex subunit TusD [Pasteurella testudinis]SMB84195.1 tRNA 2-thiouridine synthesizing protein D [Pasteurella testudinis DSM 23072]SUB50881.1 sulfurtransferase TusD [Pasteurella testudinis]
MRYVLQVTQPLYGGQGSALALQLAQALLANGHQLTQIFFYRDGVYHGNAFTYPANDEPNLLAQWQAFAQQHQVRLNLCVAAAQRRGVVSPQSAVDGAQNNLADGFELAGLGEFSRAVLEADRLITV